MVNVCVNRVWNVGSFDFLRVFIFVFKKTCKVLGFP